MPKPSSSRAIFSLSSTERLSPSLCVPSRSVVSNSCTSDPTISPPENKNPRGHPRGSRLPASGARLAGGPLGNDDGGDRLRVGPDSGGLDRVDHDSGESTRAVSVVNRPRVRATSSTGPVTTGVGGSVPGGEDASMVEET